MTNVHSASTLVQEEIFGPVLTVQTFRTPKEAVALANNTKYGLGASVWTENVGLALETAISIRAGAVWVNGHNMFDAAAGFGGYKESGYGREGGREGLHAYVKPKYMSEENTPNVTDAMRENERWGQSEMSIPSPRSRESIELLGSSGSDITIGSTTSSHELNSPHHIDRTPKMYVGGKQKRPDQGHVRPVLSPSGT